MPRAFTLMEIVVALAILVLLAGAFAIGYEVMRRRAALNDAGDRWATAFRMARAEASLKGKRVRIDFDPPGEGSDFTTPVARIELEPIEEPNTFVDLDEPWARRLVNDLVDVESCRQTGPDALAAEEDVDCQPILFYPDGSSDTVEVILCPKDPDDVRRLRVSLNGFSGEITTEATTAELLEADGEEGGEP